MCDDLSISLAAERVSKSMDHRLSDACGNGKVGQRGTYASFRSMEQLLISILMDGLGFNCFHLRALSGGDYNNSGY